MRFSPSMLPFADAASEGLPMGQLLRLSLFQVSVGMATTLLVGTLNRVMIVELGVAAAVVAAMIALPVLIAPFRALLGFRSDTHRSSLGWKRVPYLWFGSLWQMGGLAIMPFALIVLSGEQAIGPEWAGEALAALAFLMTGLGIHMTQTAGLALASDRASEETRPRVVALLYVAFLIGMGVSALIVGALLENFTPERLIRVIQGCASATVVLNLIALWKQEGIRTPSDAELNAPRPRFAEAWADMKASGPIVRLMAVVVLGTFGFNMQDVLLEPYGGQILNLSVAATTSLTAMWATGALIGFALSARWLARGIDPWRMAARGILLGIAAFTAVVFSAPTGSTVLFFAGAFGIGLGGGLFSVATLTSAMAMPGKGIAGRGLVLGAWGAAQATAQGLSVALGGGLRDLAGGWAMSGAGGVAFETPAFGYSVVYQLEIALLFATLVALGPLVRTAILPSEPQGGPRKIGIADFPT
ncbi:PucC family protein [Phaeovulum vinaykumarii]|nr:PucC family protein [Phaeovulum vinaykumarii]